MVKGQTESTDRPGPMAGQGRLRPPLLAGLLALAVIAAVVLVWFQPQKLFIDERVEEAVPGATSPGPSGAPTTGESGASDQAAATPSDLAHGEFVSLDHPTSGTVRVLDVGNGERVVRLEGFETDNGPDLFVYLTTSRADAEHGTFDDDFINLGRLKGNQGDQNYEVQSDVDLARYRSVVIWCDRFNSPFGAADLSEA